ncbi:hypothetical protein NM688_g4785 [Phlebia brevispora]|uniref:Uncharacterized protein n=1 Tax=Phlebia brevispora TaxID=194682 RepID=A0ACC1T1M5_9APHY|nr:hypothetical protein NM688_g4785 [Phlebia brevispora]
MSRVEPGSLVLVTGVNGHVASTVAMRMLQKGYRVRGTVRKFSKAHYVQREFAGFGSSFEVLEVTDISLPGAFDSAIEGVDAVVHVSSPTTLDAKTPEEQYVPAVNGTLSILRSAVEARTVKRFLYMSTIGTAIMCDRDVSKEAVTGNDWNVVSEIAAQNADDPARPFHIYVGSKIAAERAAFKFAAEHKVGASVRVKRRSHLVLKDALAVTSILGTFVFGPVHKAITSPPRLDVSLGQLHATFAKPPRREGMNPIPSSECFGWNAIALNDTDVPWLAPWVHAYDLGDLFVASLTSDKTAGKRLIACAGKASWAQMGDIVRSAYPDRPYPPVSKDAPYVNYPGAEEIQFDTDLEVELLGGKWRTLEDAVLSCARDLIEKEGRGWDKGD